MMVGAAAVILAHKMMGFGSFELVDVVTERRNQGPGVEKLHTSPEMPISKLFSERQETTLLLKLLSY